MAAHGYGVNGTGTKRLRFTDQGAQLCAGDQCAVQGQPLLQIRCHERRGYQVRGLLAPRSRVGDKTLYRVLREQGFRMSKGQRRALRRNVPSCALGGGDGQAR